MGILRHTITISFFLFREKPDIIFREREPGAAPTIDPIIKAKLMQQE
jgi:hypothetical protein